MTSATKAPSSPAAKTALASADKGEAKASVKPVEEAQDETRVPLPERPDYEVPLGRRLNPFQRGLEDTVPASPVDRESALEDTRSTEERQADHEKATKAAVKDGERILAERAKAESDDAEKADDK